MKGLILVLAAFLVGSQSKSLGPSCNEDELNYSWPDYFDNTAFYKCASFGEPIHEKCESGMWFSFEHQSCVHPSDWIRPPGPVPRTPQQIAPLSLMPEDLEQFALYLYGKGSVVPSEPPYPPSTSKYPTPPTPVPSLPPTPKPTVPPLASSTFPPKPPTPKPTLAKSKLTL